MKSSKKEPAAKDRFTGNKTIGRFTRSYCQAVAKRTKPSHKTTWPHSTVYRFNYGRSRFCQSFKQRSLITDNKNNTTRKVIVNDRNWNERSNRKERWDARRNRSLAGANCHTQNGHSPLTAWQTSLEAALRILARSPSPGATATRIW